MEGRQPIDCFLCFSIHSQWVKVTETYVTWQNLEDNNNTLRSLTTIRAYRTVARKDTYITVQGQGRTKMSSLKEIFEGLPLDPLPPKKPRDETFAHAPIRTPNLSHDEQSVRLWNLLKLTRFIIYMLSISWMNP